MNTEPDSAVAYSEIGHVANYSRRPSVDIPGLVTPGAASHIRQVDFLWSYKYYRPNYVLYSDVFGTRANVLLPQTWFPLAYERVGQVRAAEYPAPLVIYRRRVDAQTPPPTAKGNATVGADPTDGELIDGATVGQVFKADRTGLQASRPERRPTRGPTTERSSFICANRGSLRSMSRLYLSRRALWTTPGK